MRMVACDLDGTIVRRDGTVSRRTKEALTACERSGVEVVFVTGRPPRWVLPIAQLTGHRGVALCGNGAAVLDLSTDQVTESHTLGVIDVVDVVTRLRTRLPGATFALETMSGYRREPQFDTVQQSDDIPVGPLEQLLVDHPPVLKVLTRLAGPHHGTIHTDEMLLIAREALQGVAEVVHSNPDGGMLEISAPGVTKAFALARLAGRLGILSRDVVAFGDMPNDVDMLAWAGVGYAMQGGHPAAVAAAAEVAPPCEQDGVAQVLERLLFPPKSTALSGGATIALDAGPAGRSETATTVGGPVSLRPDPVAEPSA